MTDAKKIYYSVGTCPADPVRRAQIKIKRSVFSCSLAYAGSADQARLFISRISKENRTATHNCWAYIVGETGEIFHCSDGGEPSGTAGKPMLNVLLGHGMTQVAAVVTRQYGGVKLGVRGLIQAYSQSVEAALGVAPLVRQVKTVAVQVALSYGFNEIFLGQVGQFQVKIVHTDYAEQVVHQVAVDQEDMGSIETLLREYQAQGRLSFHIQPPGEPAEKRD